MAKKENKKENENTEIKVEKVDKKKGADNALADEILELNKDLNAYKEEKEKLEAENKELKDQVLRKAAEFENFKRRKEAEQARFMEYASEPIILKVIEVYNDIERALAHTDDDQKLESLKEGVTLVFNKFSKLLEEQKVTKIKTKGEPFDFNFHEALMQQESNDHPPHTVLEEIEAGYMYKDKVIKHAKVIVSQQSVDNSDEADKKENTEK